MRTLSIESRSNNSSETSGENSIASANNERFTKLINQANSVDIELIFQYYGVNLDKHNKKTTCPFLKHKRGSEKTPSLYFYPETNSFYCFGCRTGTRPIDFVSEINNISKIDAAYQIIEMFNTEAIELVKRPTKNNLDIGIIIDFSSYIRELLKKNIDNDDNFKKIEEASIFFDKMLLKYPEMDNEAVNILIEKISILIKDL